MKIKREIKNFAKGLGIIALAGTVWAGVGALITEFFVLTIGMTDYKGNYYFVGALGPLLLIVVVGIIWIIGAAANGDLD